MGHTAAQAMRYEDISLEKPSTHAVSKNVDAMLNKVSTGRMLWHLTKRHKFGLVISWAIIITVVQFMPFLPGLLIHML